MNELERVLLALEAQKRSRVEALYGSPAQDISTYRERVGEIRGIDISIGEIEALISEEDDDE